MRRLVLGAAIAWLTLVGIPTALAEDTCFDVAPDDPAAIRGITWSGNVVAIQKTGVDAFGDEYWSITFAVDRVYAHDIERDFPKGAVLAAGRPFVLPNTTCTRHGDLGLRVDGRYLVSTAFVGDRGTAMSNLAIWALDGERASIVPGLYGTARASAEISGVRTVDDALALLRIEQPKITDQPPPAPISQPDVTSPLAAFAVLAAIVCLGAGALLWRRRHVTLTNAD